MAVDLTPTDQMKEAARTGLDALNDGMNVGSVQNYIRARARKIVRGESLSPASVKRLCDFFSRYSDQRSQGMTSGSAIHTAWHLHGGDAAKIWSAARMKELSAAGVSLDDEEHFEDVKEIQLAAPVVEEDADGLIWKPVAHEGVWKGPPSMGGEPLRFVAGRSSDPKKAVGFQDLIDAFDDGAVQHVTIPKTHDDAADENTGYIRKLKVAEIKGIKTLLAGHEFIDPEVKEKVKLGLVPNSSIQFKRLYERRHDDGTTKIYPAALLHNALTPRPWLSQLGPFGTALSEADDVEILQYAENLADTDKIGDDFRLSEWDEALTLDELRGLVETALTEDVKLVDLAYDRALVSLSDHQYVVTFSIDDGDVVLADRDDWDEQEVLVDSTSSTSTTVPEVTLEGELEVSEPNKKTEGEPLEPKKEETPPVVTPPAPEFKLSEHPDFIALRDESARVKAENDQLRADKRERDTDKFIEVLKGIGLDETSGCSEFLQEIRTAFLADEGDGIILLSEDGTQQPRPFTATQLLQRVLSKLPTDEKTGKLKVQLSEQADDPFRVADRLRPPLSDDGDTKLSDEEFKAQQEALADALFTGYSGS